MQRMSRRVWNRKRAQSVFGRLFGNHDAGAAIPSVDVAEAARRVEHKGGDAPLLIDVRETWEYARGHAAGAKNIPLSQLAKRLREIPQTRDLLVICQSGHRSMQAAEYLAKQGVTRVTNVRGGTTVWRAHSLPFEQSK